jgi:hypothetical protein
LTYKLAGIFSLSNGEIKFLRPERREPMARDDSYRMFFRVVLSSARLQPAWFMEWLGVAALAIITISGCESYSPGNLTGTRGADRLECPQAIISIAARQCGCREQVRNAHEFVGIRALISVGPGGKFSPTVTVSAIPRYTVRLSTSVSGTK